MKKSLFFLIAVILCTASVRAQEKVEPILSVSSSFNSDYIFVIGAVAYDKPCFQSYVSADYNGWNLIIWESRGMESGQTHELDVILSKGFSLVKNLTGSLTGLIWMYPDKTLGTQPDFVTQANITYSPQLMACKTSFSLTRFDIYAYKEMKKGSGYLVEVSQGITCGDGINYTQSIQTFIGHNFYSIGDFDGFGGMLDLRLTANLSKDITEHFSLNCNINYQVSLSSYENIFEGFFGGAGFNYTF